MSLSKAMKKNRTILIVGKPNMDKMTKALSFVSDDPIIKYANEYDIEDNFSIPKDRGIIIIDVHYKANVDLIKKTVLEYGGQTVLISDNQKDVSKRLSNLCSLKRATTKLELEVDAPRANIPINYDIDVFTLIKEFLKNTKREEVAIFLKENKPPDIQILTWLVCNIHPNKLAFIDYSVKRRWSQDYFYELLAYSHDGRLHRRIMSPERRSYSALPKICRKLGLSEAHSYLLKDLLLDETFKQYAKSKLDNSECRLLKLGEKKRRKKTDPVQPQATLGRWL